MNTIWGRIAGGGRCPASPEEREVVDDGFRILDETLGRARMKGALMVEPTAEFFPDRWDGSVDAAEILFGRVCGYMSVGRAEVELSFWEDAGKIDSVGLATAGERTSGAGGYYSSPHGKAQVAINSKYLRDTESLVSTMAHELAHVILPGQHGLSAEIPHMEAITDLAAIYLGMGIFTANSLLRSRRWAEGNVEGWSIQRKGYISPEMAGWALALFCRARGELRPPWARHLSTDPRSYLKMGVRYLERVERATRDSLR
jgi:hypothetical protein